MSRHPLMRELPFQGIRSVLGEIQRSFRRPESIRSGKVEDFQKIDPFDPRLGTHKIHRLSAIAIQTVYSVVIEGNLRIFQNRWRNEQRFRPRHT
jgi:hypothetical protein